MQPLLPRKRGDRCQTLTLIENYTKWDDLGRRIVRTLPISGGVFARPVRDELGAIILHGGIVQDRSGCGDCGSQGFKLMFAHAWLAKIRAVNARPFGPPAGARSKVCASALAAFFLSAATLPAVAATVQALNGQAFIDRGQGYSAVSGTTSAKPGDTVMVLAGGTAEILYEDGCRQTVELGALVVVGEASPCAAASIETTGGSTYLVVGGLAVAGVVGAAIALSGGDGGGDKCITQCKK